MTRDEGRVTVYLTREGLAALEYLRGKWAPNRKRTDGVVVERALVECMRRERAPRAGTRPVESTAE